MKTTFANHAPRMLLAAGLMIGAVAANAAGGYTVSKSQEAIVVAGMTVTDVQRTLGRPVEVSTFGNEDGPTWTYRVVDALQPELFYVQFGSDGKVASATEVIEPSLPGE